MKIPPSTALLSLALLWPQLTFAHSVDESISVNGTQASATNPQTGSISDLVDGDFNLSEAWNLHASFALTHQNVATQVPAGVPSGHGGNIVNVGVGTEWDPSPHWSFGVDLALSPKSTSISPVVIPFPRTRTFPSGAALAVLSATSSNASAILSGSWMTGGFSNWETEVDLTLGGSSFHTAQRLTSVWAKTATGQAVQITQDEIVSGCGPTATTSGTYCKQLLAASSGTPRSLHQVEVGLGLTETIHQDTDVGLSWTYYAYDQDPTTVGFYTFGMAGRGFTVGQGTAVAPLRWELRPDVLHRFGPVMAELWLDWGQYLPGLGHGGGLGLRLAWDVSDSVQLFALGTGRSDVAEGGQTTPSGSATLGVRLFF